MKEYEQLEHIKKLREIYKNLELELKDMIRMGEDETQRHVDLALQETESARHWLGECLGDLGVKYDNSQKK